MYFSIKLLNNNVLVDISPNLIIDFTKYSTEKIKQREIPKLNK